MQDSDQDTNYLEDRYGHERRLSCLWKLMRLFIAFAMIVPRWPIALVTRLLAPSAPGQMPGLWILYSHQQIWTHGQSSVSHGRRLHHCLWFLQIYNLLIDHCLAERHFSRHLRSTFCNAGQCHPTTDADKKIGNLSGPLNLVVRLVARDIALPKARESIAFISGICNTQRFHRCLGAT